MGNQRINKIYPRRQNIIQHLKHGSSNVSLIPSIPFGTPSPVDFALFFAGRVSPLIPFSVASYSFVVPAVPAPGLTAISHGSAFHPPPSIPEAK